MRSTSSRTKKLTATDSTFAIVFWMNVMQLVLGVAFAGVTFVGKIGWELVPGILAIGTAGLFAHYCMTNAFRAGDASVVIPLDFMRIPLIAVVGWWLYSEPLDIFVFAGRWLDHHRHPVELARRNPPAGGSCQHRDG